MEVYSTEEEQIEALRRWWKENGRLVLIALALVLLAVFGWRTWSANQAGRAEAASVQYEQMMNALDTQPQQAMEIGRSIVGEYPSTSYADFASLAMARIAVEEDDLEQAEAHLRRVMGSTSQPELEELARLRLGHVLLSRGDMETALSLAEQGGASYRAAFDELRGDIYLEQGNREAARTAYSDALAAYQAPGKQQVVSMKLQNLADTKDAEE
ncbi:YfgM family protein [Thiohalomonas denitrificans]|uniref:Ancillary SecYEG translocon subunit n=1 Tax=Thiohalomonas denitrificans TaxID=415747 RepID=A0A1G5Q0W4_9GAMM|nr:tetratricopeptide repeat protein [Thiohalomonas denitrificans]SCZ55515.1 Putative negative regulator of RcsB-dependent stress response [Thiohalomonas denitrificans]